jgi:hypothetical protein
MLFAVSILSILSALSVASSRVAVYPACSTAGLHGAVNKTVVGDFHAGECTAFVSHKHKAVYLTPDGFPKVMRLVTNAFCEGYQCHPDELTRYRGVRSGVMADYFVFTFVKNPWRRAWKYSMQERNHASCAIGHVDYVGRVEHAAADWDRMMDVKNGVLPMPAQDSPPDNEGCEDFPYGWEFAVNEWYDDDIRAYRFPRPADLGRIFYSGTMRK